MVKFTFLIFNLLSILNFYSIYSKMARCFMVPDNNSTISGEVKFIQENESSPVMIELKVFRAVSIHGFHIHEKGSIERLTIISLLLKSVGLKSSPEKLYHVWTRQTFLSL